MWVIVFVSLAFGAPQEVMDMRRFDTLRDCNLAMFEVAMMIPNPGYAECRMLEKNA